MKSLSTQATAQNSSNDTGLKETRTKTYSLGLGLYVAQQESSPGSTLSAIRQQANKTLAQETQKVREDACLQQGRTVLSQHEGETRYSS